MNHKLTRGLSSLLLLLLATVICLSSCASKGKTLLTLDKDGTKVTLSANIYQLMLTQFKGNLAAAGCNVTDEKFWSVTDKYNGVDLQTSDDYYRASVLETAKMYLSALYLFESLGLTLSESAEAAVDKQLNELIMTDGGGSKTKLNSVLSAYGVNYDILKDYYLMVSKVDAVRDHLYGANGELIGNNLKNEYMNQNYVRFRQILLTSYNYVYEKDDNGDVIYYTADAHIAYDKVTGVAKTGDDGVAAADKKGDTIYYVNDGLYKTIAYDKVVGTPSHVMNKDGTDYLTEPKSEEDMKKQKEKAEALLESLKTADAAAFEAAIKKESEDAAGASEYLDGYYLPRTVDFVGMYGEDGTYLSDIVNKLETMQTGEIAMVASTSGYHIIMKYDNTENAFDNEINAVWFDGFADSIINDLFSAKCRELLVSITMNDKVFADVPKLRDVAVNYYY